MFTTLFWDFPMVLWVQSMCLLVRVRGRWVLMSRCKVCLTVYWFILPCWFGHFALGLGWWGIGVPWCIVCIVVQNGNHAVSTSVLLTARLSLPLCWLLLRVPLSWQLYKFPWSNARSLLFLLCSLAAVKWIHLCCLVYHPCFIDCCWFFLLSIFMLLSQQVLHVLAGPY
uniref:Uncharacterized protein n=1 Tax=Opuntia streptacantha TaxID=393608 RepID=A0A7C8YN27_OPUST